MWGILRQPEPVLVVHRGDRAGVLARCVAALIRGHLGNLLALPCTSAFCGAPRDAMPIFAGTFDGGAVVWIARLAGLGAESTGRDGSRRLKHWCQAPQGRAANLVVSALRESPVIWLHRSDLCGLQRRESPCLLVLRLNQNTGTGVLSARDSLQPWKAEGKRCRMSEIGRLIMILMHVNNVSRG